MSGQHGEPRFTLQFSSQNREEMKKLSKHETEARLIRRVKKELAEIDEAAHRSKKRSAENFRQFLEAALAQRWEEASAKWVMARARQSESQARKRLIEIRGRMAAAPRK